MNNTYFPKHSENRMKNEGGVEAARNYFLTGQNRVLYHLVKERFTWMNKYIKADDKVVVELGCGAGLSKQFIETGNLILTDVAEYEWVDRYMDALNVDYPDGSMDVIICSHMLHHLANPAAFFDDISRKLRSGGRIIIQDIYVCTLMKMALRLMRHERWSESVNVFDREVVCNDPSDPWSANCAIPKLLFGGDRFSKEFPQYRIIKRTRNECFLFFLSGGVIAKTFYLPLGDKGAEFIKKIDQILTKAFPSFFACGISVAIQKK